MAAGTSVSSSSDRKEGFTNEHYISETVVTSEKTDDFISDNEKHHDFNDTEKTEYNHQEDFEDSPIEEVRAVVSK
jgi:hypothetical protein